MPLDAARAAAALIEAYGAAGMVFAAVFLPRGIVRIDPIVGRSPWTVRLLLAPGVVALWPVLAIRWFRAASESRP